MSFKYANRLNVIKLIIDTLIKRRNFDANVNFSKHKNFKVRKAIIVTLCNIYVANNYLNVA